MPFNQKKDINNTEVLLPLQTNINLLNVRIVLEDGTIINKKIKR
jgi:hypothetical protein